MHDVLHAYVQQNPQQRGPLQQRHRQRTLRTLVLLCVEMGKRQLHFHVERNLENPIANAISAKLVLIFLLLLILLLILLLLFVVLLLALW